MYVSLSTMLSMDTKTLNLRDMPEDLVRQAKACAALRGVSLKQFMIEALQKLVAEAGSNMASSVAFFVRNEAVREPKTKQMKRGRKR